MRSSILFFLLLAALLASVCTVQGLPQVLQQNPNGTVVPTLAVDEPPTPTNGSTLEDILQELHLDTRTRRSQTGCSSAAGTYGGGGGGAFNEVPDNCGATIKRIVLHTGGVVDSIQITYRLQNGNDYTGVRRGGSGGGYRVFDVNVDGGERIIGVFGKTGGLVDQIGFVTNHGRIFGPHGGDGGGRFHVNSCHVRGIFGRFGGVLDSIGFFCSQPETNQC